jgi:hypothetical protein
MYCLEEIQLRFWGLTEPSNSKIFLWIPWDSKTKNDCAGESQEQFSSQSAFKGIKKQFTAMKFDSNSPCNFPRWVYSRHDRYLSDNWFQSISELLPTDEKQGLTIRDGNLSCTPTHGFCDIATYEKAEGRQIWQFQRTSNVTSHLPCHLVSEITKNLTSYEFLWSSVKIPCIVAPDRWPPQRFAAAVI